MSSTTQIPPNNLVNPQLVHPSNFFFRPRNDFYHYLIKCNEFTSEETLCLLNKLINEKEKIMQIKKNEYIFFYQQKHDNRFYKISCKIVPPFVVNNCLATTFGIECQQNMEEEHLAFNDDQKKFVEFHLKQYLSQYLLN
ncbi:hypothetical protein C1645_737165 [Glomus cerebriforme]|uniref:Uncharacterized protein n=1 Tax=Glomus cerebriforme TaxID=658196 RepID=A0A397T8Q1_9GLOM|nr:hypothetical protein C1645_737165 [Glomus cerebriforme]